MGEPRGSIAFSTFGRPPVPVNIFSCSVPPSSKKDELPLTDGFSCNYNGQVIPAAALKTILNRLKLSSEASEADVDSGHLTGLIFVSERENNLETLHIALRFNDNPPKFRVFSLADIYGNDSFNGVRMEDSGCIGGGYDDGSTIIDHFLIYVSTKEPVQDRRCPWTVVYKTNLRTGETERLTPPGTFDLSPSVSPSGKKIAVASFQGKGWNGEKEDLKTDIYVMNLDKSKLGLQRKRLITNGGWPTWGSENVLFFHRKQEFWRVFRCDISIHKIKPVTPKDIDAITPAAINDTKVAVATIRQEIGAPEFPLYQHIEIFDTTVRNKSVKITEKIRSEACHFNPFVIAGGKRIGYHRFNSDLVQKNKREFLKRFDKLHSPHHDLGLFRVHGHCATFSKDGSKLAFVDNELRTLWLADSQGLRIVYEVKDNQCLTPVWNQNSEKDILYVCMANDSYFDKDCHKFFPKKKNACHIFAIPNVSSGIRQRQRLTKGKFINVFPSTDPKGERLVFESTRGDLGYHNLYIMENADIGEWGGKITRLTNGPWDDSQCQWSPRGDWIAFSSTRDEPKDAPTTLEQGLDLVCSVFLVNPNNPSVVVRVIQGGNVSHPVFSPDGKSIAVAADLAAASADPISLPVQWHDDDLDGEIFIVDIDPDDISKNENVQKFHRITHSRYQNGTSNWTTLSTDDPNSICNTFFKRNLLEYDVSDEESDSDEVCVSDESYHRLCLTYGSDDEYARDESDDEYASDESDEERYKHKWYPNSSWFRKKR